MRQVIKKIIGSRNTKKIRSLYNFLLKKNQIKISETSKVRSVLSPFCKGIGLDLGYGGDPIVPTAICLDLEMKYADYNGHPQQLYGSADSLHWFKDETIDYIYSSHLLEDFEDTKTVLVEWWRVLKKGGVLILFLPDEQEYRKDCKRNNKPSNQYHIHEFFNLEYVLDCMKNVGEYEILHKKLPSNIYSFELVLKKK